MTEMKQLTSSSPLCYMLPNSQIVTALPYIDEDLPELKNKIQYLIKAQQSEMEFSEEEYLKTLPKPLTPFLDSEYFAQQLTRIQSKEKGEKKNKKESVFENVGINLVKNGALSLEDKERLQKIIYEYENNLIKEVNLELYLKLAPLVQKELIGTLDKQKAVLEQAIQRERLAIEQINKQRQYSQLEAREREQTIKDRLQVMIHKQRKVE